MRHPKLKRPILTMIIAYIPAMIPFLILTVSIFVFSDGEMSLYRGLIIFGPLVLGLIFMLKNMGFYLYSDLILMEISAWQRARQYYETDINGRGLKLAEKRIMGRCTFFGKNVVPKVNHDNLVMFRLSRRPSLTYNWARFDKCFLIYSVPFLDEKNYDEIITSAKRNIKAESKPFKATIFTDKRQKTAPVCKISVILILAENVSPYVLEKASKCTQNKYDGCIMPCVADLSADRYYFDSLAELCIGEVIPEKNRGISLVKNIVFGGRLPLKNNDKMLPCEINPEFLEMSLWDLIKLYKEIRKDGEDETDRFIKKMKTDEVRLDECLVFYKMKDKTAVLFVSADEEDEKKIQVVLDERYDYPVSGKFTISDMNKIRKRVKEELEKEGYEVGFDDENLPKSYRK